MIYNMTKQEIIQQAITKLKTQTALAKYLDISRSRLSHIIKEGGIAKYALKIALLLSDDRTEQNEIIRILQE